ncbi:MAG: sulfoxide reductase heme-binding subunit YedZ [Bryobacteraceae bacterium]
MSRRTILALKLGLHLICLAPLIWLGRLCASPAIALKADPVKFIIHFTGDSAIYILLAWISISIAGKLTARASWLIQFHRLIASYAFFWATLHLLMYVCIYSGYDFVAAIAAFHTGHSRALVTEWNKVSPGVFEDFRKRPFIDVGLLAWVILPVGAIIPQSLIQQAPNTKKSRPLHWLIYAAIIPAVLHWWLFFTGSIPETAPENVHIALPGNRIVSSVLMTAHDIYSFQF